MLPVANICLFLAALIYLIPWQLLLNDSPRGSHAGMGVAIASILLVLPMGALYTSALLILTARGGLDWLPLDRAQQYLLVASAALALTVVIGLSAGLRLEPDSQLPWALRPVVPTAAWLLPPLLLAVIALALNLAADSPLLPLARAALLTCAVGALLIGAGLLVELMQARLAQDQNRLRAELDFQQRRDQNVLAEVERMNLDDDFPGLLNFSNIHERPQIRQIALDKLSLHPDLTGAVARELTDGAAYEAIIHLQGSVPPESERLADPIRIGIERIADQLQSSIQGAHTLHVGAGMSQVERILDVLRKHADPRVDYRPAMRKLRAVFDHGRDGQVRLQAAAVLDRWLAKANRQAARQ